MHFLFVAVFPLSTEKPKVFSFFQGGVIVGVIPGSTLALYLPAHLPRI
jgi:hypothetical protein